MLHTEKNKLCINIPGGQKLGKHAGMIHAMWQAINQPMPFALVQGVEPLVVMISSTPLPDFISEGDVLSGFIGEPVDVVRCETIDLEVPASAEIVIEGYIGTETATEGPMGEYGGFITPGGTRIKPLADITGITYRDNAILPVCAAGEPPEENHTCWGTGVAASILGELRQQGFPVTTCFIPFESAMGWVVVTIDSNYQAPDTDPDSTSFVSDIGKAIFSTRAGVNVPRAIVVHDDIDPSNIRDVAWVLATRCHPDIGEIHLYDFLHNPLEIMLHSDEINPPVSPKTVYNCLFQGRSPAASARRSSFKYIYPKELQDKILSNWTSYGYEETRN
jgi:4-hydroxy-3-polyprenylbenzoate decarboxylase